MKLTMIHKPKKQQEQQLIDISSRTHLAWINPNMHDIKYLISEICRRNKLKYSLSLGSVCAHIAKHYSSDRMRYRYSDLITTEKFLSKFHLVFFQDHPQIHRQQKILNSVQMLVNYGRVCLIRTMKLDFKQSIKNLSDFNQRLKIIVQKLLSSMLLEYVPHQYSDLLLKLYLEDHQTEEQKEWIDDNKRKYADISPYHDFFQIISSLSYHIINTKKAINSEHYLEMLSNPYDGNVEWPMVLGVRNLHKLPHPER